MRVNVTSVPVIENIVCIFEEVIFTEVLWISQEELQCQTPSTKRVGVIILHLGIHEYGYTTFLTKDGSQFIYTHIPNVKAVSPSRGLKIGGNEVVIEGENFVGVIDNTALCSFGGRISSIGKILSPNQILCTTPNLGRNGNQREIQSVSIEYPFECIYKGK